MRNGLAGNNRADNRCHDGIPVFMEPFEKTEVNLRTEFTLWLCDAKCPTAAFSDFDLAQRGSGEDFGENAIKSCLRK